MNAKNALHAVVLAALAALLAACHSTVPVTTRSQLGELAHDHVRLKLLCSGDTVYDLVSFALADSSIQGVGTVERNDRVRRFVGEVPLSTVRYIQASRRDGLKTVLAIGAVGYIGLKALSYQNGRGNNLLAEAKITWYDPTRYSGGGGGRGGSSCPYVYSWNGQGYALDGEAYSVAWGKALEMETVTALPSLHPDNGLLRVRLTNERPETHYYNCLSLLAVQAPEHVAVVPDPDGRLWPVSRALPPVRATEAGRADVRDRLAAVDDRLWESSLAETSPGSSYEDVLELTLPGSAVDREGTLVITAVNSRIFDVVLGTVSTLMGDDYLAFVRAAEEDPELTGLLAGWLNDAALKVAVWTGKEWRAAGRILPQGTAAPFACGVRLRAGEVQTDSVTLRLSSLPGVWKIDAVGVDWTPASPLRAREVEPVSILGPFDRPAQEELASADARYITVLPGQQIDCVFRQPASGPHTRVFYALRVRGYMHEWATARKASAPVFNAASMASGAKIAYLKMLLRLKNIILPPIYAEWKQVRG